MKYLRWIWRNMRGIRGNMVFRVLVGIVQVCVGLSMVYACKYFIDHAIYSPYKSEVWKMAAVLVAILATNIILNQVYYYHNIRATVVQTNKIRLRIFRLLFRRKLFLTKRIHSGDITSRLETDVSVVSDATTSLIPSFLITMFQFVAAFLVMRDMDPKLAWALIVFTPTLIIFGKFFARKLKRMTKDIREQDSRIQALVQEGTQHNVILRSLESGEWVTGHLSDMQQDLMGKINRRSRFTIITRSLLSSSFGLGYLLVFIWGGLQLRDGLITFGVMTSFLQLVSQIQHPILSLLNMVPSFIHATASIDRLMELEKLPVEEIHGRHIMQGPLGVKVEHVDFRYSKDERRILHDFSFDFQPGSHTAIIGRTGAGKTTFFRLLLALIEPKKGQIILYNNTENTPLNVDTRGNFVFVPQGNTLLSGTIRENLLLGNPDATDEELKKVLYTATAEFVFNLPKGLDTVCGERGGGLSEGQAQRIAIARGLLRPGNILLLDEISSSLDMKTEQVMFQRLFDAYPDKTMIFITHREKVGEMCENHIQINREDS